jgi:hypothetical protein
VEGDAGFKNVLLCFSASFAEVSAHVAKASNHPGLPHVNLGLGHELRLVILKRHNHARALTTAPVLSLRPSMLTETPYRTVQACPSSVLLRPWVTRVT